jgi:hypothetical protein
VEFTFRPRRLEAGVVVSLLACAAVAALLLRPGRAAAATVAAVVMLAGGTGTAAAALAEPPFALSVAPARPTLGATVTVSVTPRGGAGTWDLYVVWLYSERAAFLAPDGTWRPRPVPFGTRVAAGQALSGPWKAVGPAGPATLALLAVEPGADPLERLDWRVRPSLASLHVDDPAAPAGGVPVGTLLALGLAGAVAIAIVLAWPSSPPAALV